MTAGLDPITRVSSASSVANVYEDTAYASLSAAVTAIGSAVSTLRISTSLFPNGATCTVPATLLIEWVGAGSLTVTTGQTVTIQSDGSSWPIRKLFYNVLVGQGTVLFSMCSKGYPQWWGTVNWDGTSATDAQPAFQAAVNALKNGSSLVLTRTSDYAFYSGVIADGATHLVLTGEPTAPLSLHSAPNASPVIRWKGADGGTMFKFASSYNCVVELIRWVSVLTVTTGADKILDFDGPGFTSSHRVRYCEFDNQNSNPDFIAINIAANAGQNNEFFQIHDNHFYVGGAGEAYLSGWLVDDGSITAGTNSVSTALAGYFDHTAFGGASQNWVGLPVRISKAGTAGATFESVITAVSGDGKTATLANNAITTTTTGRIFVGKGYGTAIEFGASSNIKNMYLSHNNILFAHYGIRIKNGSAFIDDVSGGFSDYDIYIDQFVDGIAIRNTNTEGSHCGVYVGIGTSSFIFDSNRGSNNAQFAEGYWQFGNVATLNMKANAIEFGPPAGSSVFKFNNLNIRVLDESLIPSTPMTMAQVGFAAFTDGINVATGYTGYVNSSGHSGISDTPEGAGHFSVGGICGVYVISHANNAITGIARPSNSLSGAGDFSGVRGVFANNPDHSCDRGIGVTGEIAASAGGGTTASIGVLSKFPASLGNHGGTADYYLFKGEPPTTSAGNAKDAYGIRLPAHPASGITGQRYGVVQEGTADINVMLAPTYFNAAKTVGQFIGTGSPEGVITANIGSTYRRTDGGAGTSFYVKESGTGNTGWIGK